MATIKEDYVSFEITKLLKEKGFDKDFDADIVKWYNVYGEDENLCSRADERVYKCPSLAMMMKWLREVYGLHISLEPCYDYDSMHVVFLAFVQNVADVHEFMDGRKNVVSYPNAEKSCELAIKYCLENLI